MHAEDLVVYESCNRHAVEDILEFFPDSDRIATLALIIEAIDAIDLTAFMVSAQQEKVLLELDFVGQK